MVSLDKCGAKCKILVIRVTYDPYVILCVPNKTKDVNLKVFNMITEIKASRLLAKHVSCDCKFKFDGENFSLNQK